MADVMSWLGLRPNIETLYGTFYLLGLVALIWLWEFVDWKRDYYVVEHVNVFPYTRWDSQPSGVADISMFCGRGPSTSDYNVIRGLHSASDTYTFRVRKKGSEQDSAIKFLTIFDDCVAAKEYFVIHDKLHLSVRNTDLAAHTLVLWAVAARNRNAVGRALFKGSGGPRKLAETDYSTLLKFYHYRPPES